ncbi:hypothetical protein EX895_002607 [Sporisorium graminicola]|uniref:Ras-GEF domain-containing protein n=1 Tax=Sporisorium graminicola TaxID=280036 RepID=A0A4U7KYW0_9BASI|nr:hypothetical protein EX895_002607 [Sporisorium graminicola]TKY88618.1 hypothetical protein EX895_002607 [Sporisorium graminicola]
MSVLGVASSSAVPTASSGNVTAALDVETTNWNAVRILADQHHLPLDALQAIRDTVATQPTKYAADHDFGRDTPLHITATRLDTGRVVFRFRSRPTASTSALPPVSQRDGIPRSSSSGAVFPQPQSDSVDTLQPVPKTNLTNSLFRKPGNLSLSHSKSIPVLRRKASTSFASPAFNGGDTVASGSTAYGRNSASAEQSLGAARVPPSALPLPSSSRSASANQLGSHLYPYRVGASNAVGMARTGSTPVSGPHADRRSAEHIQEGDVLGAVLGLGQADVWASAHAVPQPQPRRRRSSSSSSNLSLNHTTRQQPSPPELRLPELSFDSRFANSPRFHQLREAQSFESNASDVTARGEEEKEISSDRYPIDLQPFLRGEATNTSGHLPNTLVFDVLQCYRRPSLTSSQQLQRRRAESRDSLSASVPALTNSHDFTAQAQGLPTSAAPGDDPRFAVWAVKSARNDSTFVISDRTGQTDENQSGVLGSTATTSPSSTTKWPKRRSNMPFGVESSADVGGRSHDPSTASPASEIKLDASAHMPTSGKANLLAASAARLVAELTAEIDLTLRDDFFYTYREFMTPSDLLELLILRFEWAICEPSSAEDEARRRIVRVRTYVVIKHWLQHHFDFDFLPSRPLRQRLATWLNSVAKDERITARPADLNIINSLRKVVRGLKETYLHSGVGGLLLHDAGRVANSTAVRPKTDSISTFNSSSQDSEPSVATTSSSASGGERSMASSGSASSIVEDVNLDFSEDQSSQDSPQIPSPATQSSQTSSPRATRPDLSDSNRAAAQKAAAESVLVSHRHTLAPLPPAHQRYTTSFPGPLGSPSPLPHGSHGSNALSRAFAQTVNRISKFKRALNNRGLGLDGHHELDAEAEECSDLLFAKGGLDSLLQYFAVDQAARLSSSAARSPRKPRQRPLSCTEEATEEEEEALASQASEDSTGQEETPSLAGASTNRSTPASSIDLTRLSDKHASQDNADPRGLGIGIDNDARDDEGVSVAPHAMDLLSLDSSCIRPLNPLGRTRPKAEELLHHAASEQTLRSVSRVPAERDSEDEFPRPTASSVHRRASIRDSILSNGAPRIVQIDDIDLSSDEDDFAVRKALRRLPGARDLRQANTIRDLEPQQLTLGRASIDSMASSIFRQPTATRHVHMGSFALGHTRGVSVDSALFVPEQLGTMSSTLQRAPQIITTVQSEMLDPDEALQGYELVKGFRLDDIDSDDEEPGDVEAALRRLEGIIDEDRQKAKAKRVERLWQRSMARNANADTAHDSDDKDADIRRSQASVLSKGDRPLSSSLTGGSLADADDEASNVSVHPCDRSSDDPQHAMQRQPNTAKERNIKAQSSFLDLRDSSDTSDSEDHSEASAPQKPLAKPSAAAMPRDNSLQTRPRANSAEIARQPTALAYAQRLGPTPSLLVSPKRGLAPVPPVHRSFLLSYRSESVARQMCLIEAELLRSVSWDELASSRWRERRFGAEVTDWEAFYRDRVRDRLEAQRLGVVQQERAVEAIVARFNLTANWVASEVVLTQDIDERAAVISKLIRIAWKCYLQSNFASLAQIIFGLSTPWVERLRRTWNRVGYYEMRMWRDLNSFVGPRHNFRHLRNAMLQLAESSAGDSRQGGPNAASTSADAGKPAPARGCIPFFGLYVSDLMQFDAMPTLLDPTSPTMAATTTSTADGKLRVHPVHPHAFDELAPLPPGVTLEPLINVLKFRSIAEVIRQIAAFQSAAKNYSAMFEAEKGAYVRCLKLRCLPGELLARLSHLIEP